MGSRGCHFIMFFTNTSILEKRLRRGGLLREPDFRAAHEFAFDSGFYRVWCRRPAAPGQLLEAPELAGAGVLQGPISGRLFLLVFSITY